MRRALAVIVLVTSAARAASANPVDLFGFGARAISMGGAQTAATTDGGANYYNPAALAVGGEIRIDVGYQVARPSLSLDGGDQGVSTSRGLAAAIKIPGHIAGYRFAIGAALFLPDQRVLLGRSLPAEQPRWALYDNRPQRLFAGAHLAVALPGNVYAGAGVAFMADTAGRFDLTGRLGFPDSLDTDFLLDVNVDATPVGYPQAGVLWKATDWLDIGASFRGEFVLTSIQIIGFDGEVGPDGMPIVDDATLRLDTIAFDLFQPTQVAAGFAAHITRRLLVAGDLTFQRWSAFENPTPRINLELDAGQFNDLIEMTDDPPPLADLNFHDTASVRLGVELEVAGRTHATWKVRGGYAYDPSPAPEQVGENNFVDNDKHTVSTGAGVSVAGVTDVLPRPFDIDLFVALTVLPERAHRKISAADPIGDYVSSGRIWAAGATTSWRF